MLPAITCPLLFIQGEKDEYGTLAQPEKTVSLVTGRTEKKIIVIIGHTPHKEAPELALEAAKIFIDSL